MSSKTKSQVRAGRPAANNKYSGNSAAAATLSASAQPNDCRHKRPCFGRNIFPYVLTFLAMWAFCFFVYGDVFVRTAEANFVTTDAVQMKFLTDRPFGHIYWAARFLLLAYKNVWVGSLSLALLLTLSVVLADRVLRLPRQWRGATSVLVALMPAWMMWRGTSLYYKNEPSLVFLLPVAVLVVLGLAALLVRVVRRGRSGSSRSVAACGSKPWGAAVAVVVGLLLAVGARVWNENVILTAKMQNAVWEGDWESLVEDGLSARRATRSVAAYYAISLVQTHRLLNGLFDIAYDFPDARLDKKDGAEEYGLFVSDCNFYAGLINASYHAAMEHVVMNGPNLYYLKRMAICAILNQETALAEKYLALIGSVPFENGFVEKYAPMVHDRTLVESDAEFSCVLSLYPQESRFEQHYRTPAFLGYNIGLMSGSDATLETALAACLYTKELQHCLPHIQIYAQRHQDRALPQCVQQAVALAALSNPAVQQTFPDIVKNQQPQLNAFLAEATPIIRERTAEMAGKSEQEQAEIKQNYNRRLRKELRENWLGSYFYYYYCENNEPNQVRAAKQDGVN